MHRITAQTTRFFRISGPTTTSIIAFQPDGTLIWSNVTPGATYTIQTAKSPSSETNWMDYVQVPATTNVMTNLLVAFNPPAGMTLVPAGSFTMGNTNQDPDITDANLVSVYVSGFYMDVNLVTYSEWQSVYSYATGQGYFFDNAGSGKAANQPV